MSRYSLPARYLLASAVVFSPYGNHGAVASATRREAADAAEVDRMSRMGGTVESHLSDLVTLGSLAPEQFAFLVAEYGKSVDGNGMGSWANRERERPGRNFNAELVRAYLKTETERGAMDGETAEYVGNVLHVGEVSSSSAQQSAAALQFTGRATKSYADGTNGIVSLLGRWGAPYPVKQCSTTSSLYNGIWGVKLGEREYALQCSSSGLSVVDVTDPASPYRVQEISMNRRIVWRDVVTRYNAAAGKTYAYVAADGGDDFYVIDLSYLSTSATGNGVDSNPIPSSGYVNRGRRDDGHTVSIDETAGLLFLNGATGGRGCHIFDLEVNPWNPPLIASHEGSSRDCHDSFARDGKLYSAEGYYDRVRIVDLSSVRSGALAEQGLTSFGDVGGYAHSVSLTDDSSYMFAFEEDNNKDITVFDMSSPNNPSKIGEFQWSGDGLEGNSIVHNGQVRGNYLLTAYYQAGFRVFDITDPLNINEAGKYDTFRDPDGTGTVQNSIDGGYCGAWNLHSYLPSGNILVSDATYGLFILKLDDGATSSPTAAPVTSSPTTSSPTAAPVTSSPTASAVPTGAPSSSPTGAPAPAPPPTPAGPECGGKDAPCAGNGDCCSNNCKNSTCKGGNRRRLGHPATGGQKERDWLNN